MRNLTYGDLTGRYGAHQVHFYIVPAAGQGHAPLSMRLGDFIRRLFTRRPQPEGHGRILPGQPIESIGGYYPPTMPGQKTQSVRKGGRNVYYG